LEEEEDPDMEVVVEEVVAGEVQLACALLGQVGTTEGLWVEAPTIGGATKRL